MPQPVRRRRRFAVALAALSLPGLLLPAGGCSLFKSDTQQIAVTSTDPQARLLLGEDLVGVGSANLDLRRDRNYRLTAEFADGTTRTVRLSPRISTTGTLDIIGGILFLVPFVGAFAPGFYDLKPETVRFAPVAPPKQSATSGDGAHEDARQPTRAAPTTDTKTN